MDPGTHSIINLVDKHGINPPTVCNFSEAFIEISGPFLDFKAKASGDIGNGRDTNTSVKLNDKMSRKEPASRPREDATSPGLSTEQEPHYQTLAQMACAKHAPSFQMTLLKVMG